MGHAHSVGDLVVHLPADGILFCGDIVIGWTPWLDDADPASWLRAIDRLLTLDFDTLLMGHGAPADKSWARFIRAYIADLIAKSQAQFEGGAGLADATGTVVAKLAPTYADILSRQGDHNHRFDALAPANVARLHALWTRDRSEHMARGA